MHITIILLIVSIIGLVMSFFLVGGIVCIVTLILGIRVFAKEKSIPAFRIIAVSAAGAVVPLIMYFNTYGFSLPLSEQEAGMSSFTRILRTNYSNLGFEFDQKEQAAGAEEVPSGGDYKVDPGPLQEDETIYVSSENVTDQDDEKKAGLLKKDAENKDSSKDESESSKESIFESLDSISENEKNKGGIVSIAPSDDDMPSYGGIPVGTLLIAQYFREDDHNCNPVLVLQNKTGGVVRYECRFIARDESGEELSVSEKTVEVVRDGALFVFEGRFDKRDLGGKVPDSFEFSITKRDPYESDMADKVSVYTATEGSSALLTAENRSDKKVKVDAYVLFFDGKELVDCMWMIPQNTDEVCLDPGTAATIRGDAYYRFDRVETFYTAYEAVGE